MIIRICAPPPPAPVPGRVGQPRDEERPDDDDDGEESLARRVQRLRQPRERRPLEVLLVTPAAAERRERRVLE